MLLTTHNPYNWIAGSQWSDFNETPTLEIRWTSDTCLHTLEHLQILWSLRGYRRKWWILYQYVLGTLYFTVFRLKGCVISFSEISDLRRNNIYSAITNWMRLIFLSFLPLVIIIFFNIKVYKDIKERSKRSFELKGSPETKVSTLNVSETYFWY